MTLRQALAYFLKEAAMSLFRSWKVSLLAILTIAMSLFMGGFFFLLTHNLSQAVVDWGQELKVVVYLESGESARLAALRELAASPPWVSGVKEVSTAEARRLFQRTFPSLSDLATAWGGEPFPPSLEVSLKAAAINQEEYEIWIGRLREQPQVSMVDDDRDWLNQLTTLIFLIRSVGFVLGLILLGAAIFTIASVVRLTAYLYLEEITVMRLVGATEFFIRGPFYTEGFLQGLLGALVALLGLYVGFSLLDSVKEESVWLPLVASEFLSWRQHLLLIALGGMAGLTGAVLSLRKENLDRET